MRVGIIVLIVASLCGCAKKKSEDKSAAPPASSEPAPAAQDPAKTMPGEGAAVGGAPGSDGKGAAETRAKMPSDDGGEAKAKMPSDDGGEVKKPMPSDDGGEATKKACTQTTDCSANHDCCNGFCFKQGTAKHSIECKLPAGKL